ncbi:MAG: hypothetical protein AAB385_05695 [Planctomycetota bacterium]
MLKKLIIVLVVIFVLFLIAGCVNELLMLAAQDPGSVRVYLVNGSSTRFVAPNLGLCPQGLETLPHNFVTEPPVIGPGQSVSYTTRQLAGASGDCSSASPSFMVGLCGWSYGNAADSLTRFDQKYGGQIGMQFNCGDTVILRWTDGGPDCGTWSSEVLSAPGNTVPTAQFQQIATGGSCTQ